MATIKVELELSDDEEASDKSRNLCHELLKDYLRNFAKEGYHVVSIHMPSSIESAAL